tara:strand:+ start:331 stop:534 length:204 start_codon:yes stop_codon:yes gene_type:complete
MLYLLCWNGEEYKITSEIEGELVQMLCSKEEADRVLKMYVEEGYGMNRGYSKVLNSYLDTMIPEKRK